MRAAMWTMQKQPCPDLFHFLRSSLLLVQGLLKAIKLLLQECQVLCVLSLLLRQSTLHFWPNFARIFLQEAHQRVLCGFFHALDWMKRNASEACKVVHSWSQGKACVLQSVRVTK